MAPYNTPGPRRGDISQAVFGRVDDTLPGLDDTLGGPLDHPMLTRLAIVEQLDLILTLTGHPDGVPFTTGHRGKVTRGLPRLDEITLDIVSFIDRVGYTIAEIVAAYVAPRIGIQAVRDRLRLMLRHGLIEYATFRIADHDKQGAPPRIYRLTAKGWNQVARPYMRTRRLRYDPDPVLTGAALMRLADKVGAAAYAVHLLDLLPNAMPFWHTPSWPDGHLEPPKVWDQSVRPNVWRTLTRSELCRRDGLEIHGIDHPSDVRPDVLFRIRTEGDEGRTYEVPLYLSYNRNTEPGDLLRETRGWESLRVGWAPEHHLLAAYGYHQGALLHVFSDVHRLRTAMEVCDGGYLTQSGEFVPPLSGGIGVFGRPERWYYPARENVYFALESDLYEGSLRAFQIPAVPPGIRTRNGRPDTFYSRAVHLVAELKPLDHPNHGRGWTGQPFGRDTEESAA